MNAKRLDAYLDIVPKSGIPFVDVTVMKNHEMIYAHASGFTDNLSKKPDAKTDIYRFFSSTKPLTCIAAMTLVEQGKIRLDDPVARFIPEFAHMTVRDEKGLRDAVSPMTVENLFTMTAGLGYDTLSAPIRKLKMFDPHASTLDVLRAISYEPLKYEPGTRYLYSFGHDVLAGVVEIASGMRFSDYVKKAIFDPLGLKNLWFSLPEGKEKDLIPQFEHDWKRYRATERPNDNLYDITDRFESGGAGLCGTAEDYSIFLDAVAMGGVGANGARILKPETVAMLTENHLSADELVDYHGELRKAGYGWGLCCRVHMNPDVSLAKSPVGEFGWDSATGCYSLMDVKNGVSIFLGAHVRGSGYIYQIVHAKVRDLVYEDIL